MKRITEISELRSIQMSALDAIARFCDSHGLRYTLSSGTLIGAVRHKGYIPWDDDIDLYMPRQDYERFLDTFSDPEGIYSIVSERMGTSYYYPFAKVIDSRTLVKEEEVKGFDIGVWVDIFPIDYVPDSMSARKRVFWLNRTLNKMWRCKVDKGNPLHSRIAYLCYRFFPITATMVRWLQNHLVFNNPPAEMVSNLSSLNHRPFPASFLDSTVMLPFEGREYRAMAEYDRYLTITYGDYMKLPPEDQRVHHLFEAYWK